MSCLYFLAIAGLRLAVELPNASWAEALAQRFGPFAGPSEGEALPVRLTLAPPAEAPGGMPRVHRAPSGAWLLEHDQFRAEVRPEGAQLWVHAPDWGLPEDDLHLMALDGVLRLLVAEALAERGGLLLHAAGFEVDGQGFVGFGPSGAGKTTLCGLAAGEAEVLCDEAIAVVPGPGGYWLHSSPFFGAWGRAKAGAYPLGGLGRLRQAPTPSWSPLSPAAAVAELLGSAIAYGHDAEVATGRLAAACALVEARPVVELAFAKSPSVWGVVREFLQP